MGDIGELVFEAIRGARWNGLVVLWEALIQAVSDNPWLAVIVGFVALTAGWKKVARLAKYVGSSWWGTHR